MILTKAIIVSLPEQGDNTFKVRVPLMEDNSGSESIFNALLCSDPANYHGYNEGDCVYVNFEDELMDSCVILGKLFTSVPSKSSSYVFASDLKITDNAELPETTKIGEYTVKDISNLYNAAMPGASEKDIEIYDFKKANNFMISTSKWTGGDSKDTFFKCTLLASDGDEFKALDVISEDDVLIWDIKVDPTDTSVMDYKTQIKYRAWCTTLVSIESGVTIYSMKKPEKDITLSILGLIKEKVN